MTGDGQPGLATTIAAAAFLWCSTALAYSPMPAAGHAVFSNLAIDLFNQCVERGYGGIESRLKKKSADE